MGRIIAITNQKGGVGKTTTAINLSACLAEAGQRVLTVDFDPQGNTTSGLGLEKGNIDNTVYELLMGECTVEECINPSVQERLDVMPSDVDLAGAEIELLDMEEKESILKKNLELLDGKYDFIIIDCPPSLNLLTINALTAANTVLVPIQCEYYALEGLSQVLKTVNLVQKKLNPALEVEGVAEVSCGNQNRKVKDLLERANVQSPVTVEMRDGTAEITLEIVAAFGARIPAVAEKVQENVKSAVQNMTNVTVSRVDLVIAGLAPAVEPQA